MNRDNYGKEPTVSQREVLDLLDKIEERAEQLTASTNAAAKVLSELSEMQQKPHGTEAEKASETPEQPQLIGLPNLPDNTDDNFSEVPLILHFDEDTTELIAEDAQVALKTQEDLAPERVGVRMRALFPLKTDSAGERFRKWLCILCAVVFMLSLGFLTYYTVIEPQRIHKTNETLLSLYTDQNNNEANSNAYPVGMQASFRKLYDINADVAGWLSYFSSDADTFLNINLPIVHCDNNDTYLSRAFDGSPLRSGTLFFEAKNTIAANQDNKVHIVYGHNMANGTMFAGLNKLVDNVYRARAASSITLNTLYNTHQYQVFAVLVCDESAPDNQYFGYLRTEFQDDGDFINYVAQLRARSLYDYPVDVNADDHLLILSTCSNKSQVKIGNGRLVVVARRVRDGESHLQNTAKIVKNEDVIMPYAWYTAQNATPHRYYTDIAYTIDASQTVTTTAPIVTTTDGAVTTTTTDDTAVTTTSNLPIKATKTKATTTKTTTGKNTTVTTLTTAVTTTTSHQTTQTEGTTS